MTYWDILLDIKMKRYYVMYPQNVRITARNHSDETHFWLNGYVNKKNFRIWDEEQPEEIQELKFYPEKTTVWCGLWVGEIIGPHFYKNYAGENVTVNDDRYGAMITDYLMTESLKDDLFQQDGATSHTSINQLICWENTSVSR